jgi:hypothetical protein
MSVAAPQQYGVHRDSPGLATSTDDLCVENTQAHRWVRVWVVYLTPKIERIISLLSAYPVGEARLPMPKGMAYKD